ncbi:Ldh family oxidoreductase [Marinomonas piezotolerans]|uniref:Ldh family oxidoreductase n=1 Tax=Marinomonas piezotolerans TaxID=2213058 RepID=A0A370U8D3_9GAMM|nr:Ldh family oxidoreductase [Marinomonas piezotolerans]RDL44034.1 Ldh family oxidoreductase [Marinomonas piezotolerans]
MLKKYSYEDLVELCKGVLIASGCNQFSTDAVAEGLCEASLRGVDSHGIRLLPHYLNSLKEGRKNGNPDFGLTYKYPSVARLNADNAVGLAAGRFAIIEAMKLADEYGVSAISVHNSSHPAAMASTALTAARKGYLVFAFTNADALVLSENGTRPFFGTNPVCFAAPRRNEEPFCLDMAVSKMPWNKVLLAKNTGDKLPDGYVADSDGLETNDPVEARSLFPAGEYKGFGLAAMVEVMCGVFAGGPIGRELKAMYNAPMDQGRDLSQMYIVMKCDASVSESLFLDRMSDLTQMVRNEPAKEGKKVMMPNDPQINNAKERDKNGVPLDEVTISLLSEAAESFGLSMPQAIK